MNNYIIYNYISKKKYRIKSNVFVKYSWWDDYIQKFLKAIALKLYPVKSERICSVKQVSDGTGKGGNHPTDNWKYCTYHCYDSEGISIPNTRFTVRYISAESIMRSQKKCKIIWENNYEQTI